jgi:hypothetical protein
MHRNASPVFNLEVTQRIIRPQPSESPSDENPLPHFQQNYLLVVYANEEASATDAQSSLHPLALRVIHNPSVPCMWRKVRRPHAVLEHRNNQDNAYPSQGSYWPGEVPVTVLCQVLRGWRRIPAAGFHTGKCDLSAGMTDHSNLQGRAQGWFFWVIVQQ